MAECRPRRSMGMARRGWLRVATAALAAMVWSAALAHDESVARRSWAESAWLRVWPVGVVEKILRDEDGYFHFVVLIAPLRLTERGVYLDAGRTLCPTDEGCLVTFFSRLVGPANRQAPLEGEPFFLGSYFRYAQGAPGRLHFPCESAGIAGCEP